MLSVTATPPDRTATIFAGVPWAGVARLLERAAELDDLRVHRLQLLEAERRMERGQALTEELDTERRSAVRATLVTRSLLARVREMCDGPILVLKGPEVSAVYPASWLRPYTDVDILVPDAVAVERRLRGVGFRGVGPPMDWDALHHVQRLVSPEVPATVEVHRRPKWVSGGTAPTIEELLQDARPSATGVDGVLAPSRAYHAVLLAAHAWAERPLGRLGDLVDVAAMLPSDSRESELLARRFGIHRLWRATLSAIDALLVHDRPTWPTSTWARHLGQVRERTVIEAHLARLLEPLASRPLWQAPAGLVGGLRQTLLPHGGEGWSEKLDRSRQAIRSARAPVSEHRGAVEGDREDPS